MMKVRFQKMAFLVGGIILLGVVGFSACCRAEDVPVQPPIQRICESPFGPVTPMFQDVKQIYLLWDYKAEQPDLLSKPLREETLKKEVLAYMQTYLTPCSKSKDIEVIGLYDNDNSVVRDKRNLIAYVLIGQNVEIEKNEDGSTKRNFLNSIAFNSGFYRAGSSMTKADVFLMTRGSLIEISGEDKEILDLIHSAIEGQLRIRGKIH